MAGVIDNLANGGARPFFGWVSDQIGREYTMAIAFTAGGVAYWLLGTAGTTPWTFVICAALIFFTWGEIFSLFPSTCTDMFGPKYATTNTSLLYTAKGLSAFVVPLANVLKSVYRQLARRVRRGRDHELHRGARWRCSWCGRCGSRSARRKTRPRSDTPTRPSDGPLEPAPSRAKTATFRRRQRRTSVRLFSLLAEIDAQACQRMFCRSASSTMPAPKSSPNCQNVNITAAFFHSRRRYSSGIKLTIGIMYTNMIGAEDVLRLT